tara:strand:+ start:9588 stop:10649 length:1062 start_codon:yes stop_codon:yes gene_type:complete
MTNIPTAVLAQRYGRRMPLVIGPFIAAFGNGMAGIVSSLELLMLFRFIAGIGSATFITGAVIFIGDISTISNRGRMMSVYQSSFILGISSGPVFGGLIAELFGLRAPFLAVGALSIMSGVWAFFKVPETLKPEQVNIEKSGKNNEAIVESGSKYSLVFSRGFILIALVFMITFFTRAGAQFTLLPLMASKDLGLSPGQIGAIFTIPPIIAFLMLPLAGSVSDKYGRKKTIVPGLLIVSMSLFLLGSNLSLILFIVGMSLYGFGSGIEGPTPVAYVADISPKNLQGIAQGIVRSAADFALLVAPPLMGFVADVFSSSTAVIANAVAVGVLGVVFLFFAKETAGIHSKTESREET